MSYEAWLELLLKDPMRNLRSASQYILDVFLHWGVEERDLPTGPVRRYRLFDAPWSNGDGRVAGQEHVQEEIFRLLSNFVRDARVSKLILLHGPNGSAKSSIVHCIQRAMEEYSATSEGALYTYAWIFPSDNVVKSRLGFGASSDRRPEGSSYSGLPFDQVDARLPCELRDHPIFLIPRGERAKLIETLRAEGRISSDFTVSRYLLDGDLSPRDRAIYDALLVANDGDHREVMRHIQIERFYVSPRYGRGVATVEPQMHVDADARQITADRSIANLPRALQTVPLYELHGPLVAANRGLLEYADLLKRPIEAFKYLLSTSEEATATLPMFKVQLDEVLIASSNEKQLEAFKEYPDWNSFKGRMELIRVPYLRRFSDEVLIYRTQITATTISKPLAPHVVEVAALWSVLTRLKWPDPDHYPEPLRNIVKRITPIEKLALYDQGMLPTWCTAIEARELSKNLALLYDEYRSVLYYEGQLGASAREIRTLILNAAHHPEYRALSPLPVLDELASFVRDASLYDFLKQEPRNGYHQHGQFIDVVRQWWLDILDEELRVSMGLVELKRHEELFARYVRHVSHLMKKEKVLDKITQKLVPPDEDLMKEVESVILAEGENRDEARKAIIGRIGAWGLENAGQTPDYRRLFSQYVQKMEQDYYRRQRKIIAKNIASTLRYLGDDRGLLNEDERKMAEQVTLRMKESYGYDDVCTAECAAALLKARYADGRD